MHKLFHKIKSVFSRKKEDKCCCEAPKKGKVKAKKTTKVKTIKKKTHKKSKK